MLKAMKQTKRLAKWLWEMCGLGLLQVCLPGGPDTPRHGDRQIHGVRYAYAEGLPVALKQIFT